MAALPKATLIEFRRYWDPEAEMPQRLAPLASLEEKILLRKEVEAGVKRLKRLPEVKEGAEIEATLIVVLVETISKFLVILAPPEKTLEAVQVLAWDREATPFTPQLIRTKPLEAVFEITKELLSKDKEVTLVKVPLMTPISIPGRLPVEPQEKRPVVEVQRSLSLEPEQPVVPVVGKARPK